MSNGLVAAFSFVFSIVFCFACLWAASKYYDWVDRKESDL